MLTPGDTPELMKKGVIYCPSFLRLCKWQNSFHLEFNFRSAGVWGLVVLALISNPCYPCSTAAMAAGDAYHRWMAEIRLGDTSSVQQIVNTPSPCLRDRSS